MREPSAVWWNDITGPRALVDGVIDALLERKNVLLSIPADLPWREQMRGTVEEELRQRTGLHDLVVETVDVRDQCPGEKNVGNWLLKHFADRTVASSFRERPGMTMVKYLTQNRVLENRLIWVKGVSDADAKPWIKFCREYAPRGMEDGLVVLECAREGETPSKCFEVVRYGQQVSTYDMRLFNSILINTGRFRRYTDAWKQYIAAVCAALCGTDAEVSHKLIDTTDFREESPLESLERIAGDVEFSRRGDSEDHVLCKLRTGRTKSMERDIWSAQLQVAFPLIEFQRIAFIQEHLEELTQILEEVEVTQGPNQGRKRVTDPMDLEVGTLSYLSCQPEADDVFSPADRKRFSAFRQLRNDLAHLRCCTPQKLSQVFDETSGPEEGKPDRVTAASAPDHRELAAAGVGSAERP